MAAILISYCRCQSFTLSGNVFVMTASDVHNKIKEISINYISGRPPIAVDSLANELNITREELLPHIKQLKALGLIYQDKNCVIITESGKQATLP